jgi:hypothetical protein
MELGRSIGNVIMAAANGFNRYQHRRPFRNPILTLLLGKDIGAYAEFIMMVANTHFILVARMFYQRWKL